MRWPLVAWRLVAGAVPLVIGVAVLVGWWMDLPALTHVVAGWPTMKPLTALLCALSGAALLLSGTEVPAWARGAAKAIAAIVAALALLALLETAAGFDAHVDWLLTGRSAGRPLGRTAVSFLLLACATLSLERVTRRGHSPAQILALLAGSVAGVGFLGYLFGVSQLFSPGKHAIVQGMAFHTAVAILLLAAGLLVARPDVGFVAALVSRRAGGLVARRLLLGLAAFAPVAVLVVTGRRLGWYGDSVVSALLVFLALIEGAMLIQVTAVRLNAYDQRQKATEELLRRSEQQLSQLVGQAPDGIFTADLRGRYTDVNAAGCRILGLTREGIVGKSIVDFIRPEQTGRLWAERALLLQGGTSTSEWSVRHRDGHYIDVEVSATILPDGRWQGFMRDISERKRAEAELAAARETDRQLRRELERVMGAATSVAESVAELPRPDITSVLRAIALQAQTLTGAKYVAVGLGSDPTRPYDPWVTLGIPSDLAAEIGRHPRSIGRLHQPSEAGFLGVPIVYRGEPVGNLFMADKQGAPEFNDQDRRMVEMLAARAAVAVETAKLYAGEARQRAWLRNLVEQMPEGVYIVDTHGRPVLTNRVVQALASKNPDVRDAWGNPAILDLRLPDGSPVPRTERPSVRAIELGEPTLGREMAVRKDDGTLVPILVSAAPIRDDAGGITGVTIIVQDMTPLKQLERLREEWTSVVAHDLRQPVNAISMSVDVLSRMCPPDAPEKTRKAIGRIQSGVKRLSRMISDLSDASLIETDRLTVVQVPVDLGPLIAGVVEGLQGSTAGRPIVVDAPPGQWAWIDADRIQQVLTNLLVNAVKYGEEGTEIRVQAVGRDDLIEVVVTNRGPGIAAADLPGLFTRFGRTSAARASGRPGSGLGLYIARGLVEAHGGRIWVDSTPGETTSFHFVVARAEPATQGPVEQAEAPAHH